MPCDTRKTVFIKKISAGKSGENKKKNYIKEDIKMRNYVAMELKLIVLEADDVLTASAEFKDESTGDNGVWFPGSNNDGGNWQ